MRFWDEVDEAIKKVRQGQEATCPLCKKGKLVPVEIQNKQNQF